MQQLLSQYRGLRRENYILFFGRIVTNLGAMIWPMLTLILTQKMSMSASRAALVMVFAGLLILPGNVLGGKLADRYSKKKLIIYGDLLSVFCFILCAALPLSWISILLLTLAATFQNLEGPSYQALVADITPTERREQAYSLLYLGGNLGLVLSPTLAGLLFKHYLWLAFLISGVFIGASTLLIYFGMSNIEKVEESSEEASYQVGRAEASLRSVLKDNWLVTLFVLALAFYSAGYNQFNYLMPIDLGKVHSDNGALIYGTVTSMNCILVVLFTPLFTLWFSRWSNLSRTLLGALLQASGFFVFLSFLGHIPAYYAAITLFTWGEILVTVSSGAYISKRMPETHRGRIEGLNMFSRSFLTAVSQMILGVIYDRSGSQSAWSVSIGISLFAVFLISVMIPADKKRYPKLY